MSYDNPGVSFFIRFHDLDPSNRNQCIFFAKTTGARCRSWCEERDNRRAIEIREEITALSSETISLDLLQEYASYNCCRFAKHQDRLEDSNLLLPLAQRWQKEIQEHAANQPKHTASVPAFKENVLIAKVDTTPTSSPGHTTTLYTPTAGLFYDQSNTQTWLGISATASTPVASSSSLQYSALTPSDTAEVASQSTGSQQNQPRYDLRPREANVSTKSVPARPKFAPWATLSEFRPHVAEPGPEDSVSQKLRDGLEDRDFKTGSVYMFDRTSSPGHVKIGWTASTVSGRLVGWSKCGYTPNLLFSVHDVPNAQRAETLTHHELIKEWRRERQCKVCLTSHQEWFEVSKERAKEVMGDWANFMKKAKPYDSEGSLKNSWRDVIQSMDKKGEKITAKKLLEYHEASLLVKSIPVKESVDLGQATMIKQEAGLGYASKVEGEEEPKEALVHVGLPQIEQLLYGKGKGLYGSETLSKQAPLPAFSPLKSEEQPKSAPAFSFGQLSKGELIFKFESQTTTQLRSPGEQLSKFGQSSKADSILKFGPSPKPEPRSTAEPQFKFGSSSKATPILKSEPQTSTKLDSTAEPMFKFGSPSIVKPIFESEPRTRAQLISTAEPLFKVGSSSKAEPVFKSEPLSSTQLGSTVEPLFKFVSSKVDPVFNFEPLPSIHDGSIVKPLSKFGPPPKGEPVFKDGSLSTTQLAAQPLFKFESPSKANPVFKFEPLSSTHNISTAEPLFKFGSTSKAKPDFKFESLSSTQPNSPSQSQFKFEPSSNDDPVFKSEPLSNSQLTSAAEPLFNFEPLLKTGPISKAEPLFETQPLPESKPRDKEVLVPRPEPVVRELLPEEILLPPSPNLKSAPSPQDISPQKTEPSPSTANLSIGPLPKVSLSPIISPSTAPSEEPPELNTHDKEQEAVKNLSPITQLQQNIHEERGAALEHEVLVREGQTPEEESQSYDQDESTIIEDESDEETDGWDADETLVEDSEPTSLEKAALKIVDGIYNESSTGKVDSVPEKLEVLPLLKTEAPPPALAVAAQA